jgi:hypothetical protein
MGRFDTERYTEFLSVLLPKSGVAQCMHYPGMTPIPEGYDNFAHAHAGQLELLWQDVCPAYALALVALGSYTAPRDDAEMEVQWDELGGDSTLLWPQVRPIIERAWIWLQAHAMQARSHQLS